LYQDLNPSHKTNQPWFDLIIAHENTNPVQNRFRLNINEKIALCAICRWYLNVLANTNFKKWLNYTLPRKMGWEFTVVCHYNLQA
jgi:hypothetical protein